MKGTGVNGGIAYAPLLVIRDEEPPVNKREAQDAALETERFDRALTEASKEINALIEAAKTKGNLESAEIFDYQLLLLEDDDFAGEIRKMIYDLHVNTEYALAEVSEAIRKQLLALKNDYLCGRTADISDLEKRLQYMLSGRKRFDPARIGSPCIIAAKDLSPSQTAGLNPEFVKGIATEQGSGGSHTVIIARSLGIPCVIGADGLMESAVDGIAAYMDAGTGEIMFDPDDNKVMAYQRYESIKAEEQIALSKYINRRTETSDGHTVGVYANIASEGEADLAVRSGCDGVGLFRTEFLYMENCAPPSYEAQLRVYTGIARKLGGRPLVIRTLDAGGDKDIPYLAIGKENNPFMGFRAIRYCLEDKALFKTQLSAIISAAVHPGVELMLPMIATLSELRQARELIEEARREYFGKCGANAPHFKVGMMIETPSAAFEAERYARETDFFSIGTNDLTQYLFAADRGNAKVSYLNSCFHPALLRLVRHVCDSGRKQGIHVDICGHAAEVPLLVPLFVAMGIDNLSVSVPSILKVRRIVCSLEKSSLNAVLDEALSMDEAHEVEKYLKGKFPVLCNNDRLE